jgi:non-ribosomal peptide synthetase component E (peptide arylation enzyme)
MTDITNSSGSSTLWSLLDHAAASTPDATALLFGGQRYSYAQLRAYSVDLIRQHRVTHIHANHEIIRRWFDSMTAADDVSSLKMVNCGSGMAGASALASAHGVAVRSIYGSSGLQARFSRQRPEIAHRAWTARGGVRALCGRV